MVSGNRSSWKQVFLETGFLETGFLETGFLETEHYFHWRVAE
jgi:hypothetical protein